MIGVEEGLVAAASAGGETTVVAVPESSSVAVEQETIISQSGVAYQCPACPRTFDRHNAFYGHLRSHKAHLAAFELLAVSC